MGGCIFDYHRWAHFGLLFTGMTGKKIVVGRPRISVDFTIVLRMRDMDNLGWSRMAEAYREITGQYISRDTIKRRYLETKRQIKDSLEASTNESLS